jgi:hypothetical protein
MSLKQRLVYIMDGFVWTAVGHSAQSAEVAFSPPVTLIESAGGRPCAKPHSAAVAPKARRSLFHHAGDTHRSAVGRPCAKPHSATVAPKARRSLCGVRHSYV